jgi:hypothetical protein
MASAWWNVQMIKRVLPLMRSKKFLYVIQEFEPGLYPWSTRYALAQETYGLEYFGLLNEALIVDYMQHNLIGRFADPSFATSQCAVFEPAIDRSQFRSSEKQERRKRLLFYARPESAARNLFELGLFCLNYAVNTGVFDGDDWEFYFVGEKLPDAQLNPHISIKSLPWMGYGEYAPFVADSDIALSLMLSPHTSYLPLEIAAGGGQAVTSVFANKTREKLESLSRNIIGVDPTFEDVVSGLKEAVRRVRHEPRTPAINLPSDWNSALSDVVSFAIDRYREMAFSQMITL